MFLSLYRGTQTYSWYDIAGGYDEETGEYYPDSGEETTVFYQYALFPECLRADDGGQGGRKDGFSIDTDVELVSSLPEGADLRAPNTLRTLYWSIHLWLHMNASWVLPIYQPSIIARYLNHTALVVWSRVILYMLVSLIRRENTCTLSDDDEWELTRDLGLPYDWEVAINFGLYFPTDAFGTYFTSFLIIYPRRKYPSQFRLPYRIRRVIDTFLSSTLGMWLRVIGYTLNAALGLRGTISFGEEPGETFLTREFDLPYCWELRLADWQPLWNLPEIRDMQMFALLRPVRTF